MLEEIHRGRRPRKNHKPVGIPSPPYDYFAFIQTSTALLKKRQNQELAPAPAKKKTSRSVD
jgi:hypothetical protein